MDVHFARAGPADTGALAVAMRLPEAEVAARMARGCRAFVLWHGEDVASYCWVSIRRERVGELARDLAIPAGESYIWDCATVVRFRGQGLYPRLLRAIAEVLGEEGQRRVWIGASSTHAASSQTFAATGFRPAVAAISLRIAGRGMILRITSPSGADPALAAAARRVLTGHS